ncbi:MAG: hypothetical protein RL587_1080 [Actinomycetota bacterium]|jgi:deoxyribodipyrimidine photolyase-related protein
MNKSRLLYVPFDQLNENYGILKNSSPATDLIVMVESLRMTTGRNWHPEKLYFLISSARHFAQHLENIGFQVEYIKSKTTLTGIKEVQAKYPNLTVHATESSSYRGNRILQDHNVQLVPNDFFLTSRFDFNLWASNQKSFIMENFYRAQRIRLDVLIENGKPTGGNWNFDKDNRLPPPKNYDWPAYLEHQLDEIDLEVSIELSHTPSKIWATTRTGAVRQLTNFLTNHFADFGPLEDAMTTQNWSLHHSLLSPYLNNGILHPSEVVEAALDVYRKGNIPIASCEGFIRQIIGWREYVNGMYWYLGEDYRDSNKLNSRRELLPLFMDSSKTSMNCVKQTVFDIEQRAWVHHIPRLMILSNLALLTGINPQVFLDWMREVFIDAADWVMVPNVIGMGLHADGGQMMTKPYIAGGSYISRMSDYCKNCHFDPKKRTGDDACPFTTLYWDFLDRHLDTFKSNHRMFQQNNGLKKLKDLPEVRKRALKVLKNLDAGTI